MAPRRSSKSSGRAVGRGGGAYAQTARILNQVWDTRTSLKTCVYDKQGQLTCTKATYALCTQVLRHETALRHVIQHVLANKEQPPHQDRIRNRGLLYATVYELVAGRHQKIQGGGAVKRHILAHETALREAWQAIRGTNSSSTSLPANDDKKKNDDDDNSDNDVENNNNNNNTTPPLDFPRYIRVNTLRTTTAEVLDYLRNELRIPSVAQDADIPDLLVVPQSATPLLLQQTHRRHDWILQDKSSCFSAYCLVHGFDNDDDDDDVTTTTNTQPRVFLDACAAPGNKTTHLAALAAASNPTTTTTTTTPPQPIQIYALDRSRTRFESLRTRVQQHVPAQQQQQHKVQVHAMCGDFLAARGSEDTDDGKSSSSSLYAHVTDILLDPSCSGSGIFTRHDQQQQQADDRDRIRSLQQFQITALLHAMTQFPHAQRIVYSTCSTHVEENEGVVAAVLAATAEWQLVAPTCLTQWSRRGRPVEGLSERDAACLIRVDRPDRTNGFFVACFQRRRCPTGEGSSSTTATATTIVEPLPTLSSPTRTRKRETSRNLVVSSTTNNHQKQNRNDNDDDNHHNETVMHNTITKNQITLSQNKTTAKSTSNNNNNNNSNNKRNHDKRNTTTTALKREPAWVKQSGNKKKRKKR